MQLGLFMCWYHFARRTAEFSEHTNNINYLPISMVPSIIMFSCYALQVFFFFFKDFLKKELSLPLPLSLFPVRLSQFIS